MEPVPAKFWRELGLHYFPADCFGIIFFFPVVIFPGCNLNPPKNIASQTTVPFFSCSNFSVRKYHNWCSCQNTNTNYDPKKIRPEKKGTVIWLAMFFEPPEKITIPPNFGGNWDYIIFRRFFWERFFFSKQSAGK